MTKILWIKLVHTVHQTSFTTLYTKLHRTVNQTSPHSTLKFTVLFIKPHYTLQDSLHQTSPHCSPNFTTLDTKLIYFNKLNIFFLNLSYQPARLCLLGIKLAYTLYISSKLYNEERSAILETWLFFFLSPNYFPLSKRTIQCKFNYVLGPRKPCVVTL